MSTSSEVSKDNDEKQRVKDAEASETKTLEVEDIAATEQQQSDNGFNISLWLPVSEATTWANSVVSSAKEKTKSTLEAMKKDIHEISDVISSEATNLASSTVQQVSAKAQMIQQLIGSGSKEDGEQGLDKTCISIAKLNLPHKQVIGDIDDPQKIENNHEKLSSSGSGSGGSLFSIAGGFVKQIVHTVQRLGSEDTTHDEDEYIEEVRMGRHTLLDQFTLQQLQNDPATFLQAPTESIDLYRDWLSQFNINEYSGEINILLSYNPHLREIYAQIVPGQVENHTFWNRYFFKVHLKELDREAHRLGRLSKSGDGSVNNAGDDKDKDSSAWSMCESLSTTTNTNVEADFDIDNERYDDPGTPTPINGKCNNPGGEIIDNIDEDWEDCTSTGPPQSSDKKN